jgi:O-antigen ligase
MTINEILISIGLSVIVILSLKYIDLIVLGSFILIAILLYKGSILIPGIIIIFLSATGPSVEKVRDFITLGGLGVLIFSFLKKKGFDFRRYSVIPAEVVYLVGYIFISVIISTLFTGINSNSLAAFIRLFIYFFLCYILFSSITEIKMIQKYIISLLIASVILSVSVYLEIASSGISNFIIEGQLFRFAGLYGNPNYMGMLLMITISLAISMFFGNRVTNKGQRIILWLILLDNIIIMLVINSRAAIIGVLLSVSFILFNMNRKVLIKTIIISFAGIGIILLIPFFQDFLLLFIRLDTIGQREYFWNAGLGMISDHPIFGVGPDMFLSKFYNYLPSSASYLVEIANTGVKPSPHNFILYFTSEMGVFGLIAVFYLFGLFFYMGFKSIISLKRNEPEYYLMAVTMTGIGIGVFFRSFYEVDGVLTYGYITRDLAFWLIYLIQIFIYQRSKAKNFSHNKAILI